MIINMLLFCPCCDFQHVDAPDASKNWDNPAHRSHLCADCGYIWRPADVPTNGVQAIHSRGDKDQSASPTIAAALRHRRARAF